jgi:serine protease
LQPFCVRKPCAQNHGVFQMKLNPDFLPTKPRRTLRLIALASSAIAALVLAGFSQASEPASGTGVNKTPLKSSPAQLQMAAARAAADDELPVSRLIVKMRDAGATAAAKSVRIASLSGKVSVPMKAEREGAMGTSVLLLNAPVTMREARALATKMAGDSAVEYVVPEQHVRALQAVTTPNDTLYSTRQWHFFPPAVPFAINGQSYLPVGGANLPGAWALTTGVSTVRVAVVDTGILPNHPELAANIIPGYDFIRSDTLAGSGFPPNFIANDNDGRDADATDPGDWVTTADKASYAQCRSDASDTMPDPSSWHGTHVAGTIAAVSNNARGVAGIGWNVRIMPLRVLGKCGGSSFDIVDAMLWAAGIDVAGVPRNPTPVDVINLSLGGSAGKCDSFYQDAVNRIVAKGVTIVAATGNEAGAVIAPANCSGVIAVTGHSIEGDNTDFANTGPEVAISAPAGGAPNTLPLSGSDVVNPDGTRPGRFVYSTGNLGDTTVAAYGYAGKAGTSMSAPHVAGVAALIRSIKPGASPAEILSLIKASARPHPAGGFCAKNANACGAGLLDAGAALRLVSTAAPPTAVAGSTRSVPAGTSVLLDGSASTATAGRTITAYEWTQTGGPSTVTLTGANTAKASFAASAAGDFIFTLRVTDSASISSTASVNITVSAAPAPTPTPAPTPAPSSGGGGGSFGLFELFALLLFAGFGKAGVGARARVRQDQ